MAVPLGSRFDHPFTLIFSKWKSLTRRAMHLQDVITNEHYNSERLWTSSIATPYRKKWVRFLQWLWYVKLDAFIRRVGAILGVGMTLIILSSQASTLFPWADLSLIGRIIHWKVLSPFAIEFFTLILLLYLATCCYSSFMKVRIFRYYRLVPYHTDERSLLFFAAYLCRLAFPLGYNYLSLIEGHGGSTSLTTEFSRIMGPMDLIPIMGKSFLFYFALGLLLICLLVFFRLHGWLAQQFSSDSNLAFDDYLNGADHLLEGRELINQARRQEERTRSGSNDFLTGRPSIFMFGKPRANINATTQLI